MPSCVRRPRDLRRGAAFAAALTLATTMLPGAASAQGLLDFLFGNRRSAPTQSLPPQAAPYADPNMSPGPGSALPSISNNTGRFVSYCVRTCDGRYFPMQRHANATPAQLCNAFCPAAKTQVFSGSQIDTAVAPSGERYADTENAFVYRQKVISDCTCNGRDVFGLAPIDVAADPTLRAGDLVVKSDGALVPASAATRTVRADMDTSPLRPRSYAPRPRFDGPLY